jgi:hypothetical protein
MSFNINADSPQKCLVRWKNCNPLGHNDFINRLKPLHNHHDPSANNAPSRRRRIFLWHQLTRLATERNVSLTWLFILLSPIKPMRQLLATAAENERDRNDFNHRLKQQTKPLKHTLTLHSYLQQAIESEQIIPSQDCLEGLTDTLELLKKQSLPANKLYDWFNSVQALMDGILIRIHLADLDLDAGLGSDINLNQTPATQLQLAQQSTYVELQQGIIGLYGIDDKPIMLRRDAFLNHLQSQFSPPNKVIEQQQLMLELYVKPGNFSHKLALLLNEAQSRWQAPLAGPLADFL